MKVFEKPKQYKTRSGLDVLVFCRAEGTTKSIGDRLFGVVNCGDGWMDASWTIGGKFNGFDIGDTDLDLVAAQ
jgi:hypothetical protein